jgi:hypothetical protein
MRWNKIITKCIKKLVFLLLLVILASHLGFSNQRAYASTLSTGITSYWKLDEASGTRADSASSNNLTDVNSVGQATGKIGSAGQFTISGSKYLSIADNASLSTGSTDFTVSVWVYIDAKGGNASLCLQICRLERRICSLF